MHVIREQVAAEQPDSWPAQNDLALSYNHQGIHALSPWATTRRPRGSSTARPSTSSEKRARLDPADFENKHTLAETLYYEATCAPFTPATKTGRPRVTANA